MSSIIPPEAIESELIAKWDKLAKENKLRACLFNLIVFNRYSARTDYIRDIVQKVAEKFPCRVLFISEDPNTEKSYLKTAVDLLPGPESSVACDYIDIGVAGKEVDRVPSILLPHIIPDLPVTLLWAEDPCAPHPLFEPLTKLVHRLIFDSESADSLLSFAKKVLSLRNSKMDVADLNWARTEGWRDLICSMFDQPERLTKLKQLSEVKIVYNNRTTETFCHLKIQSMYLLAWLASRLEWKVKKADKSLQFSFNDDKTKGQIQSEFWEKLGSGTITSVHFEAQNGFVFDCQRIKERYHYVQIQISSTQKCDLPYQFLLGQTATGQSLVKEICRKGTSDHYLEMLERLLELDKDQLC